MNSDSITGLAAEIASGVALAVLPLTLIFGVVQITMLRLPGKKVAEILVGTGVATIGLFLFLLGVSIGFLPFGHAIGRALGELEGWALPVAITVVLGFVTAWSEPSVRILADQVEEGSNGSIAGRPILYAICIGVAVWVGLGMLRIELDIPIMYFLGPGYALVTLLMFLNGREFVSIAADSSGVATGPIANSFLLSIALGAAASQPAYDPILHGLGFVGLIALAPLISVLILGLILQKMQRQRRLP